MFIMHEDTMIADAVFWALNIVIRLVIINLCTNAAFVGLIYSNNYMKSNSKKILNFW